MEDDMRLMTDRIRHLEDALKHIATCRGGDKELLLEHIRETAIKALDGGDDGETRKAEY